MAPSNQIPSRMYGRSLWLSIFGQFSYFNTSVCTVRTSCTLRCLEVLILTPKSVCQEQLCSEHYYWANCYVYSIGYPVDATIRCVLYIFCSDLSIAPNIRDYSCRGFYIIDRKSAVACVHLATWSCPRFRFQMSPFKMQMHATMVISDAPTGAGPNVRSGGCWCQRTSLCWIMEGRSAKCGSAQDAVGA